MCNRAERGVTHKVLNVFGAKIVPSFNKGPIEFHPKSPGLVVREADGARAVERTTWGIPVTLRGRAASP